MKSKKKGICILLWVFMLVVNTLTICGKTYFAEASDWKRQNSVSRAGETTSTYWREASDWKRQNPVSRYPLYSIWGSSGSNIFAVGGEYVPTSPYRDATIYHYDGNAWSPMTSNTDQFLNGVWGSSGTDVFAVGMHGTILHYNGSSWSPMTSGTTQNLRGIWGSSGTDVFAVGMNGTILHYNGSSWSPMNSGTSQSLNGIWGRSGTDVFAVGGDKILHYNGNFWSAIASVSYAYDIWGSGSDFFVVFGNGGIFHYDGTFWVAMDSGTTGILYDVWGISGNDVFAVGEGGIIIHYDGSPSGFSKISPCGVGGQSTDPTLTWGNSSGTSGELSYEYCYDTIDNRSCDGSWVTTGNKLSVTLGGLISGTNYYWQVRARNVPGTTEANSGDWCSFTTGSWSTPPIATTNVATGITSSGGTLNGTVNANNGSTTVTFEYGLTSNYGYKVTADQSPINGNINTPVSKVLTGLLANSIYYYRVAAINSAGMDFGDLQTFKTLATPAPGGLIYLPIILNFR